MDEENKEIEEQPQEDLLVEEEQKQEEHVEDNGIRILRGQISASDIASVGQEAPQPQTANPSIEEQAAQETFVLPPPVRDVQNAQVCETEPTGYGRRKGRVGTRRKRSTASADILGAPSRLRSAVTHPDLYPQAPRYKPIFGGSATKRRKVLTVHRFMRSSFGPYLKQLKFNFNLDVLSRLSDSDLDEMIDEMKFAIATKADTSQTTSQAFFMALQTVEKPLGIEGASTLLQKSSQFKEQLEELSLEHCDFAVFPIEYRFLFSVLSTIVPIWVINRKAKEWAASPEGQAAIARNRQREEQAQRQQTEARTTTQQ
jgi:hypothetical protein